MKTLTNNQILSIIKYTNERNMPAGQIARRYQVSIRTITRWIARLRKAGYVLETPPKGRQKGFKVSTMQSPKASDLFY